MTTPDWTKAPEGATHWGPNTEKFHECWYKISDDGTWVSSTRYHSGWVEGLFARDDLVPRPHAEDEIVPDAGENRSDGGTDDLPSKYHRRLPCGAVIDVYDVLVAWSVTNPADAHAIKKMLMPGKRGHKDAIKDRQEAIASLHRAIEIEQQSAAE